MKPGSWFSVALGFSLALGCSRATIGLAEARDQQICLRIQDPDLRAGTSVLLLSVEDSSMTASLRVEGRVDSCTDDVAGNEFAFYSLEGEQAELSGLYFAIAPPSGTSVKDGSVDLDQDGVWERFRSCASAEGLHLTVWSGEPLIGPRKWHHYYYLGYDVEPNCTERDYPAL